jgi:hypothetical protein
MLIRASSSASSATRARGTDRDGVRRRPREGGDASLPVTLLILVLTFGSLVAAGIPLLLALTAVIATFGLIALTSHLVPVAMEARRWCC